MNIHVLFLQLLLIIFYVVPPASAPQVLELKVCAITAQTRDYFEVLVIISSKKSSHLYTYHFNIHVRDLHYFKSSWVFKYKIYIINLCIISLLCFIGGKITFYFTKTEYCCFEHKNRYLLSLWSFLKDVFVRVPIAVK